MYRRSVIIPVLVFLCSLALPAAADLQNGTFDAGMTGWTVIDREPAHPSNGPYTPTVKGEPTEGHPGGYCNFYSWCSLRNGIHGGISQTAQFGIADSSAACRIDYDYRVYYTPCSAYWGTARIRTYLDGVLQSEFKSPNRNPYDSGWLHDSLETTAGVHTLAFWATGNYGWYVQLDNVTVVVDSSVAIEPITWSRIKTLTR